MKRKFNGFFIAGLTGTIFIGSFLAGDYFDTSRCRHDSWWTPMSMALTLNQSRQEFELYIQGEMLQKCIEEGTLLMVDDRGTSKKVTAGDVKVRLNNRHKVKADKLPYALAAAFFLGISMSLLALGLMQFVADKKEKTA